MDELIDQLRKALPPVFLGSASDELTGGAVRWRTIQNKRSRREIPDECFLRSGTKNVLVKRDSFLDWWGSTLRPIDRAELRFAPHPRPGYRARVFKAQRGSEPAIELGSAPNNTAEARRVPPHEWTIR